MKERIPTNIKHQTTKSAVVYVRCATLEPGDSEALQRQRRHCQATACRLGASVVETYTDAGISGNEPDRAGLTSLLERLEQQPSIDFVIVERMDRVARNIELRTKIMLRITATGARLISGTENLDDAPSARLMVGVLSTPNHNEAKNSDAGRASSKLAEDRKKAA